MAKHETGYFTRFESGSGFDFESKKGIRPTVAPQICWRNKDGSIDVAMSFGHYYDNGDLGSFKRRMQAKMNVQLGRFRAHLARTGKRWEVEQRQERQRKEARKKAAANAASAIATAGMKLESPLPCYYIGGDSGFALQPRNLSDSELEAITAGLISEVRRRAVLAVIKLEKD
jgi:hypothetical protein